MVNVRADNNVTAGVDSFFTVSIYPNSDEVTPAIESVRHWRQGTTSHGADATDGFVTWKGEPFEINIEVLTRAAPNGQTAIFTRALATESVTPNNMIANAVQSEYTDTAQLTEILLKGPTDAFLSGTEVTITRLA